MWVCTLTALASALLFAVTTNLQRVAASAVPSDRTGSVYLLRRLVRDRRWLLGGLIGVAALALHAIALARGSVTAVQAVMALGLIITLAIEALRERRRLCCRELAGAGAVVAGVLIVVGLSRPASHDPAIAGPVVAVCALVVLPAWVAVVRLRGQVHGEWAPRLLAVAAGACFAVDAVFLQALAAAFDPLAAPSTDPKLRAAAGAANALGFALASFVGGVAGQHAYQLAPLRSVQPALSASEPVAAFLIGVTVLGEGVRGGAMGHPALVCGVMAIAVGILVGLPQRPVVTVATVTSMADPPLVPASVAVRA